MTNIRWLIGLALSARSTNVIIQRSVSSSEKGEGGRGCQNGNCVLGLQRAISKGQPLGKSRNKYHNEVKGIFSVRCCCMETRRKVLFSKIIFRFHSPVQSFRVGTITLEEILLYCKTKQIHPAIPFAQFLPGNFLGITKYHYRQYVSCWKQWQRDELVDVLCPSGACEKFSGGFLISISLNA